MGMARSLMRYIAPSLLGLAVSAAQAANPAPAQTSGQNKPTPEQSAEVFVQSFYDWYTGDVQESEKSQPSEHSPEDDALESKRWPLSDEIVKALKADRGPHPESADEIDSLDFDPFLDAQDDCFPYKAGKVTHAGSRYRVEVFSSNCSGPNPELPSVVAEIEQHDGKWTFVNFIYPRAETDLLSTLKGLKEEREKTKKQPH